MEVIVDELRKNDVNIDKRTLSHNINDILDRQEKLYGEMAERLSPEELVSVFAEMNVNSFGRAMAYLTLVYLTNIPEDAKREAVSLVATVLRDVNVTRVEESFSKECFLGSKGR